MTRRRRIGALAAAVGLVAACAAERVTSLAASRAIADRGITAVRAAAAGRLPTGPCPPGEAACIRALVVTEHLCLVCRDVGYLVRTLRAQDPGLIVVLAPAAERKAVVRFLAKERAVVPVVAVPDTLLSGAREPSLLGYFELDHEGAERRRAIGYDAGALLGQLSGSGETTIQESPPT